MSPEERDRLVKLEVLASTIVEDILEIKNTVTETQKDVSVMKTDLIKWGAYGTAVLALGGFFGFLLTQLTKLKGLFVP